MSASRKGGAAVLLFALGVGGSSGCTTGDCDEACHNLGMCMSGFCGWDFPREEKPACSGELLCQSRCINEVDCAVLKDAYSGAPSAISKGFFDCVTRCAAEK